MNQAVNAVHIVIPFRLGSTRFPEKVLKKDSKGKLILQRVFDVALEYQAVLSGYDIHCRVEGICPESELEHFRDGKIRGAAYWFGTYKDHQNGTSRVGEMVESRWANSPYQLASNLILHIQADEPELTIEHLHALYLAATSFPVADVATLSTRTLTEKDKLSRSSVKVTMKEGGFAAAFKRQFKRDSGVDQIAGSGARHIGVYAYRPQYALWYQSVMFNENPEVRDGLEQNVAMDRGFRFRVWPVDGDPRSINTPEDYEEFLERDRNRNLQQIENRAKGSVELLDPVVQDESTTYI